MVDAPESESVDAPEAEGVDVPEREIANLDYEKIFPFLGNGAERDGLIEYLKGLQLDTRFDFCKVFDKDDVFENEIVTLVDEHF